MSLSPIETKFLEIRSYPENKRKSIFSFEMAIRVNVTQLLGDQIKFYAESDKGSVINVYGPNKSGRTTVAKTLTTLIERERDPKKKKKSICVTFNFLTAFEEIEKDDIMIIEQGEKLKTHKEKADTFGLEQIVNACNNKNAIALIVSDKKLIRDNVKADYYLKCEAIVKENQTTYCVLEIDQFHIGRVEIYKLHNEVIERGYKQAKEEFMKKEVDRIFESISETTKDMLDVFLEKKEIIFSADPKKIDPDDPPILLGPTFILGGPRTGKSTLIKILVNKMIQTYGSDHVYALRHKNDITGMLTNGFSAEAKHFIQVFVADDFTYSQTKLKDLNEFVYVAHNFVNATGILQAKIFPVMNVHYFTGKALPPGFRAVIFALFLTGTFDHAYTNEQVLPKFFPEIYLSWMDYIRKLIKEARVKGDAKTFEKLKGFGLAWIDGDVYPYYLNLENHDIVKIDHYESCPIVLLDKKQQIDIREVDNDFIQELRIGLANFLQNFTNNEDHIRWYIDYYANEEKLTHQDIAERYELPGENNRGRDSVAKAIKRLREKVLKEGSQLTGLGHVLELVLEKYFQSRQQNYSAGTGGSNQPDLLLKELDLAINCKFRHRPESTYSNMESTPENEYSHCWLAIYDRENGLRFHENKEKKAYVTVRSREGISIREFEKKTSEGYKKKNFSDGEKNDS